MISCLDDSSTVRRTERMWTGTESSEETPWGLHMGKESSTYTGKGQAAAGARNSASLNHKTVIQCVRCLKEQSQFKFCNINQMAILETKGTEEFFKSKPNL